MQTAKLPQFPALQGNVRTSVLVIGGGLTGLLCAHFLKQAGIDCIVAEAHRICGGTTGRTTAKITAQHGLIYDRLRLHVNLEALSQYKTLCRDIDCEFSPQDSYVYAVNGRKELDAELETLHRLGYEAQFAGNLPLPLVTNGAVKFPEQAQFHPLKFAAAIAEGQAIFENTLVREWDGHRAFCDGGGTIQAEWAIAATHFPFWNRRGGYFLKLYQERHYVLALEQVPLPDGMYVDASGKGFSFRSAGNLLLLGGGSHRTGKQGGGWDALRSFAATAYPTSHEWGCWAAQDCMSLDGMPYIGAYSPKTPRLLVAAGFSAWGMTGAMAAARLLADHISGHPSPHAQLFNPNRRIWRKQLFLNGVESVSNLLMPKKPRCTHLGCALQWNAAEHTWDCPCHGSRFAQDGHVLENPAVNGLSPSSAKRPS